MSALLQYGGSVVFGLVAALGAAPWQPCGRIAFSRVAVLVWGPWSLVCHCCTIVGFGGVAVFVCSNVAVSSPASCQYCGSNVATTVANDVVSTAAVCGPVRVPTLWQCRFRCSGHGVPVLVSVQHWWYGHSPHTRTVQTNPAWVITRADVWGTSPSVYCHMHCYSTISRTRRGIWAP